MLLGYFKGILFDETVALVADIINAVQIFLSLLVILAYVASNGPLILRYKWDEHVESQRKLVDDYDIILENIFTDMTSSFIELTPEQERQLLHLEGPYSEKVKQLKGVKSWDYYLISATFICTDYSFIYYLFYCAVSCISFAINPIFLCLLLLDFAGRFDMMKNIRRAD